ncbi:MAG: ribonuclease [Bacteroidia bacterium]|nr:MAG: ribonuclease [Bacteroidia bacterium]
MERTIPHGVKKIFVLDTNVMLHDYTCLRHFQDNDIVIPITALEELDAFKKGNETINFNAREFARELDRLSGDGLFNGGISLGADRGMLRITTGKPFSEAMRQSFATPSPDHRILAIAEWEMQQNPDTPVILVSKDINLRMKAKSLGIHAQDYLTGKVEDVDTLTKEAGVVEGVPDGVIAAVYSGGADASELGIEALPNVAYELRGGQSSALAVVDSEGKRLVAIEKQRAYGIAPRNAEQTFAMHFLMDPSIPLVAVTGKAGTGKTLLALASALAQEQSFERILLARPIIPLSNRDIGFLPGNVDAKIGPYMQPLFDNLSVIRSLLKSSSQQYVRLEEMQRSEKLVISPLAYIRGRSLSHAFIIIDEAQNLTPHEVKTIITRAGEGAKIVFTGDIYQIDHPYLDLRSNGLSYLAERMKGQPLFAHANLVKGERSALAEIASDLL